MEEGFVDWGPDIFVEGCLELGGVLGDVAYVFDYAEIDR